jgi:hypothetical protein
MPDAEEDERMPILTGYASRRAAGVRMELQRRADAALAASRTAEDERGAAALRGKARGLREAVDLVRALETGGRIGRRRRLWTRILPLGEGDR